MWSDYTPEEIVGKTRIINKLELVKSFLDGSNLKEILLTDRKNLSNLLRTFRGEKKSGVYCVYDGEKKEVLYVGKSKNLRKRMRSQLLGVADRKTGLRRFRRLFYSVLKIEKRMKKKDYSKLPIERKKELIKLYQDLIFRSNNFLRVCLTDGHLEAIVLEQILIECFKDKNQCKYNSQV